MSRSDTSLSGQRYVVTPEYRLCEAANEYQKYNFVLSAAFSAGIAISGIIMFFTVGWYNISIDWWGNSVTTLGCEGETCTLKTLADGERFYPWWNSWVGAP